MALSGVISEIQHNIRLVLICNFLPPLLLTPHGREPCQNFLTICGVEKLELWSYQIIKEFLR